jgi:hypothetical protein
MRGFVAFGAGAQLGSSGFTDTGSEPLHGEQKTWTTNYARETGLELEVGGTGRVWRKLFLGATYSRFHDSRAAEVTAQVPHPFFFNQPRTITGESGELPHDENALHISAAWIFPVGHRLEIGIFAGPSAFYVSRDLVENVEFTEEYPYDTATFTRATADRVNERAFGVHGGLDVTWLLNPRIGIGGTLRYSRAATDLAGPSGGTASFDAGGLHAAATLKFRILPQRRAPVRPVAPRNRPMNDGAPGTQIPPPGTFATALLTANAPVFLRPDTSLTPLRQLPTNTRVRILEEAGDWLRVEFDDRQLGRRVGYVQRSFVRIEGGR